MEFWVGFGTGFAAGFFANVVFRMFLKALPATWVRYEIDIGEAILVLDSAGEQWLVNLRVLPTRSLWRMLMNTLIEYVTFEIEIDSDGRWFPTKWVVGDWSENRLRLDGVMGISCYLLSRLGHGDGNWHIADQSTERSHELSELPGEIAFRVRRFDGSVAGLARFRVVQEAGRIRTMRKL